MRLDAVLTGADCADNTIQLRLPLGYSPSGMIIGDVVPVVMTAGMSEFVTPAKLRDVAFPGCLVKCTAASMFGVCECGSVCPTKFDSDGVPIETTAPADLPGGEPGPVCCMCEQSDGVVETTAAGTNIHRRCLDDAALGRLSSELLPNADLTGKQKPEKEVTNV